MPKVTTSGRKSFDELYEEYSSKSIEDQITNLKQLGRELVTRIDKIVDQLDDILEMEFDADKVTCTVDDKEVNCDTWEDD